MGCREQSGERLNRLFRPVFGNYFDHSELYVSESGVNGCSFELMLFDLSQVAFIATASPKTVLEWSYVFSLHSSFHSLNENSHLCRVAHEKRYGIGFGSHPGPPSYRTILISPLTLLTYMGRVKQNPSVSSFDSSAASPLDCRTRINLSSAMGTSSMLPAS